MSIKVLGKFIKLPSGGIQIPPEGKDNKLKRYLQQNCRCFFTGCRRAGPRMSEPLVKQAYHRWLKEALDLIWIDGHINRAHCIWPDFVRVIVEIERIAGDVRNAGISQLVGKHPCVP